MPIEFSTSLDLDLLYARWYDRVDLAQFKENFKRYLSDENYRPGRTELIDLSDLAHFDLDFRRIWGILSMVNAQLPGVKVTTRTVLIAPFDLMFGFSRMFQSLAENAGGVKVEVYRNEEDALTALDLPYATIDDMLENGGFRPHTPRDASEGGAG